MVIIYTNIYGFQAPCVLPVINWFVGPPINFTCGRFSNITGLYISMISFANRTTGRWSDTYFNNDDCDKNEPSIDSLSTTLPLQNYVALLYHSRMLHYHIILDGQCHITDWYCKIFSRHLCNKWYTLDYDSKNLCSPLQSDSTVNSAPQK